MEPREMKLYWSNGSKDTISIKKSIDSAWPKREDLLKSASLRQSKLRRSLMLKLTFFTIVIFFKRMNSLPFKYCKPSSRNSKRRASSHGQYLTQVP